MQKPSALEKLSSIAKDIGIVIIFGGIVAINGVIQNTKKLYYQVRRIPYEKNADFFLTSYEKKL